MPRSAARSIFMLLLACQFKNLETQFACGTEGALISFKLNSPGCYAQGASGANSIIMQLSAGSSYTCALQCALRGECKYFDFSLNSRCTLSRQPQNMTYRKLDNRFSRCQEVCINSRRFCIVQQRVTDTVQFNRSWTDYENGFGDSVNFWIGLRLINLITAQSSSLILRAEILDWNNIVYVAEYTGFVVQSATTNYTMNYTQFLAASSNVSGDSLTSSRSRQFSTLDRHNDQLVGSCSAYWHGGAGWWFGACTNVNPNGLMTAAEVVDYPQSIHWLSVHGNKNSLKGIRMMVQLVD